MAVTLARAKELALGLEGASERPHFDRTALRTPRKTFATLAGDGADINLMHPSGTCYGWAFHNFYAAKEELKSLSNRLGMITAIGGEELIQIS